MNKDTDTIFHSLSTQATPTSEGRGLFTQAPPTYRSQSDPKFSTSSLGEMSETEGDRQRVEDRLKV